MKRIVLWLLSTLTVVVLLFGYHTSTSGALTTSPPLAIVSGSTSGVSSSTATASGAPTSTADPTSAASTSAAATTVTGDVAQTQWGPVQVELTVADGTISNVDVVQYPNGNPRDSEINSRALPTLIQETLDAQSAQIDMVSGATVTSDGYLTSLQSALDQAGI